MAGTMAEATLCPAGPLQQLFYLLLVLGGYGLFLLAGAPRLPTASLGLGHA